MEERFNTFTVLISNINRCIHKIKTEEMAEHDLRSSHVSCLYYLYKSDRLTAKALCDICQEDKANLSRAIKFLETEGYITCTSKTAKRYQSPLTLTERGREVGALIAARVDNILDRVSEGISEEHRVIMYNALARINANLQTLCDNYAN